MKIFTVNFRVRSYECDSYGHVNNATYLNYLEFARMSALFEKGFSLDSMKKNGYLVVIRRIEIDYKFPLYMNDEVFIKTFASEARKTSGTFTQQIFRAENNQLAAEARVTWVFIDQGGQPISIPAEIQEAFEIGSP
ncbi:MAG: acyl-CoA thioesterase [Calditrichaeota bacterium]|nr:acyl-CoA thioesterase [Calditrichota bacterium]